MKEHPILFATEMAKAILDSRKTMTRRVMKPQPHLLISDEQYKANIAILHPSPYGQVGDRLWVRETWALDLRGVEPDGFERLLKYRVDGKQIIVSPDKWAWYDRSEDKEGYAYLWRPSIFMPRWASRILLEITQIRVERLQEITHSPFDQECHMEGFNNLSDLCLNDFMRCWDSLNAKRGYGWDTNPWVWVISFKRLLN